jgi:hypothetical protein
MSNAVKADKPKTASDRGRQRRQRDPRADRYNRSGAYVPGSGLGTRPASVNVDLAPGAVQDPYDPQARIAVSINRKVDLLEYERGRGLITVSQYEVGRQLQAVFERASGARVGGDWLGGVSTRDQTIAHELQILYAVVDAQLVKRLMRRVERAVGVVGARLLQKLLLGDETFASLAIARGMDSRGGRTAMANRFRWLLEAVDEEFAARGSLVDEVRAWRAEVEEVEVDERGRQVPRGQGYRWGRRSDEGGEE